MSVRPELLIRGLDERPTPPSDLAARIEALTPGAGLLYTKASWAITLRWREDDPRRQWIQNGSMQPEGAFDVIGHLPVTCSIDEAPALIARELKNWPDDAYRDLRESIDTWNTTIADAALEDRVMAGVWNDLDAPQRAETPEPPPPDPPKRSHHKKT